MTWIVEVALVAAVAAAAAMATRVGRSGGTPRMLPLPVRTRRPRRPR